MVGELHGAIEKAVVESDKSEVVAALGKSLLICCHFACNRLGAPDMNSSWFCGRPLTGRDILSVDT